jgi:hypothetical protein
VDDACQPHPQEVADGARDAQRLQLSALEGLDDQDWFSDER